MDQKKRPGFLTKYARHAGISLNSAAEQLRRVGVDYMQSFDFAEADKLRLAMRHADREAFAKPIYVNPGESPRVPEEPNAGEGGEPKNPAFAHHQTEREKFRAKLAELDFMERIGKLVDKEKVEAEAFRIGRLVRDAMLNIPSRLAGILAAETDQRKVYELLEKEIRQALEALAIDDTGGTAAA